MALVINMYNLLLIFGNYILSAKCVYGFRMNMRINSDYYVELMFLKDKHCVIFDVEIQFFNIILMNFTY